MPEPMPHRSLQELRDAEERMRSVVDHVIDGIITIDGRGRIESFNKAAEKLFGYEPSEVLGQNVRMLMPEPYRSEHDRYISSYLTTGQAKIIGTGREVVGQRKDGSTFPMDLAVSEFHVKGQRYFTGIVRDITERKELEYELRRRVHELAVADQQKNEFLAMLAHELRNPLAPMRNALHLMQLPGITPDLSQRAQGMIERQLEYLVRLVDDLLDLSRIISGRIELRRESFDLAEAVERAVEMAQGVVDAHGHELDLSLPDERVWIEGDLVRVAQVVANLLTNAAKYTEDAGRIWVTAAREDGRAVVRVRDSGIGIAPEMQERIFELFVQGDQSLARSQGGLGIGLTLVKRLVDLHGGSVSVSSPGPGGGSEFTVSLPALAGAPSAAAAPRAQPGRAAEESRRRRILVVDDNVDVAESIAMILELSGYEVRCLYEGTSVLKTALSYRPDVVVLDIGLPGMSGYEVARQLRGHDQFRRTPLIAVTGYGQASDRDRAREAGFDQHLTKPVDPRLLQEFIDRLAGG